MLSPTQLQQLRSSAVNGGSPSADTTGLTDDAAYNAWKSGTQQSLVTPQKPGYLSRVGSDYGAAGTSITDMFKKNAAVQKSNAGVGEKLGSEVSTGFNTAGDVAGAAFAPITEAPGVHQALGGVAKAGGAISDQLMKIPGYAEFFNGLANHLDAHPDEAHTIGSAVNLAMLGLGGEGEAPVVDAAKGAVDATKGALTDAAKDVKAPALAPSDLLKGARTFLSKDNVTPNLETSVGRLADGEKAPLDLYNEFHDQEIKAKTDVNQDTALGQMGSRVGESYDKVAEMRRTAGTTMSDEMAKVGDTPVDVTPHVATLEDDLKENGLNYDPATKKVTGSKTSKVTDEDRGLIEDYIHKVEALGSNPSAAELDAFLSRTPKELDVFKRQNNITKVTNGERIVKSNLREMGDALKPSAEDQTFAPYAKAKSDYASLSKFLDEGSSFLGKKTASGDYAKDASMLKSAVKSILNSGKKDWLVRLEKLTGHKALDETVMALQAMKDAGDSQGESLLNLLAGEGIPKSPSGLIEKGVMAAGKLAKQKLAGSPADQTRTMIQNMLDKAKSANKDMEVVGDPETKDTASSIADRHLSEAEQVVKNVDPAHMEALGGMKALMKSTITNLTDGLKAEGHDMEAKVLKALDGQEFTSIEQLKGVVNGILDALPKTVNKSD